MTITREFLTKRFNEFNSKYFNNEIPMVHFEFSNTRNNLGRYTKATHSIRITTYYKNITEHDVEEILIHEMVHAWQHSTNHEDRGAHYSHGVNFYRKADMINRMSNHKFHISRLTALSDESKSGVSLDKKGRGGKVYMLVCRKGGVCNVGRVTQDAMVNMQTWLWKHYDKIEAFSIKEEHCDKFKNYVVSRKSYNYHTICEEEFESNVKPYIDEYLTFQNKMKSNK